MKKALRILLNFLERKFPDKVEVRVSDLNGWVGRQAILEEEVKKLREMVDQMQSNLNNVNTALGFAAPKMGVLER